MKTTRNYPGSYTVKGVTANGEKITVQKRHSGLWTVYPLNSTWSTKKECVDLIESILTENPDKQYGEYILTTP